MRIHKIRTLLAALSIMGPAVSAQHPAPASGEAYGYVDLADRALPAQVVAVATIATAARLKPALAPGVAPGAVRFYVEAGIDKLLRGPNDLPRHASYLVDLPLDARGRAPKLAKLRIILFAAAVPGHPGELRLIAPGAQIPWSTGLETQVRGIVAAAADNAAPPRITGVGSAFFSPGSLPGESETQIFLTTADGRPVSLNVLRRPAEEPRWAVALGEMVDDAAEPPARDTLLWYRLVCTLPPRLPDRSIADLAGDAAAAAQADYRLVLDGLGACTRRAS